MCSVPSTDIPCEIQHGTKPTTLIGCFEALEVLANRFNEWCCELVLFGKDCTWPVIKGLQALVVRVLKNLLGTCGLQVANLDVLRLLHTVTRSWGACQESALFSGPFPKLAR